MLRTLLVALLGPIDRLLARLVGSGFGLKDLFTIVNLLGGVASICFAIAGNLWWASFAVMLGYAGDVLDGPVARLTGRGNRFGTELDNIADHTAQCVAPAFVIYLAYRDFSLPLAFSMAALLVVAGSIRHARGAAAHFAFDLAWNGMPRPVAAFITIAFVNSALFSQVPGGRYVGVALVVLVALLNLVPIPFTSHHGRALQWWAKYAIIGIFLACIVFALWIRHFFFDVLLGSVCVYSLGSWLVLSPQERSDFYRAVRDWRQELNRVPSAKASVVTGVDDSSSTSGDLP